HGLRVWCRAGDEEDQKHGRRAATESHVASIGQTGLKSVGCVLDTPQVACYKPTAFLTSRLFLRGARHPMLSPYIPIAIFVVVATGFALFTLVFSGLLHPKKYNKVKLEPYECGIEPATDARDRYSIRYYLVALLFVIC